MIFFFSNFISFLLLLSLRFSTPFWCHHIKPDCLRIVSNVIVSDFIFMGLFYRFTCNILHISYVTRYFFFRINLRPTTCSKFTYFYLMLVKHKHEFPAALFLLPFV